ncbi:unnamed protein product, partial [Timema podura]|nr:unnamed protein product [Timema podura]
ATKAKKKKKDSDDEAFEESDDGDEEGRELDYISDSSESLTESRCVSSEWLHVTQCKHEVELSTWSVEKSLCPSSKVLATPLVVQCGHHYH